MGKYTFIKMSNDKYLVKNSNNWIVDKSQIKELKAIEDISSNKCVKDLYEGILEPKSSTADETTVKVENEVLDEPVESDNIGKAARRTKSRNK